MAGTGAPDGPRSRVPAHAVAVLRAVAAPRRGSAGRPPQPERGRMSLGFGPAPPPVSVARLLSAIDQQARAGAAPTPDATLRSLRGVAPAAGGVMLPVAVAGVAALVQENHYLTASSKEALLICYAGEAAASRI